ncbi:MAG: hypothetical protein ACLQUY_22585 [Ktedonobacterales bacterium]
MGITPRVILTIILIVMASLFVFLIAARAASRAGLPLVTGTARNANPIVIQQENSGYTPAPGLPTYTLGVWVSSMSPPASGSIQVYVRVTINTSNETNRPMRNVAVQVSSSNGFARSNLAKGSGSNVATTDANGLASFTLFYGAAPSSPVYVYATTTIDGHQISSNTVFVPG